MQNFIPQARAHSLPDENPLDENPLDENPLPDVTLCPPAPACLLPDVNPLPDVNLHPDVTLSASHLAFLLAKLSPLKLHQGCMGPTWDPPT